MTMPSDWWPDLIIIRGEVEHEGKLLNLSFAINDVDAAHGAMETKLRDLREAMWDAMHGEKEYAEMKRAIERDRAIIRAAKIDT